MTRQKEYNFDIIFLSSLNGPKANLYLQHYHNLKNVSKRKNQNNNTIVRGFSFNKFKKNLLARMFSLNFSSKPIWRSTFSLLSGGVLGSYSL